MVFQSEYISIPKLWGKLSDPSGIFTALHYRLQKFKVLVSLGFENHNTIKKFHRYFLSWCAEFDLPKLHAEDIRFKVSPYLEALMLPSGSSAGYPNIAIFLFGSRQVGSRVSSLVKAEYLGSSLAQVIAFLIQIKRSFQS